MSAYGNDPRVERLGSAHFFVNADGRKLKVYQWVNGDEWLISDEGQRLEREFPTADEAIRSLIGDPQ